MTHVRGLVRRECGRGVPQGPIHVCEYCFGPLEVDYDYAAIRAVSDAGADRRGPPASGAPATSCRSDQEPIVGRHVGMTPLVHARNLETPGGFASFT